MADDEEDAGSDDPSEIRQPTSVPVSIVDVDVSEKKNRILTGMEPLDRVMGGGIVVGSMVILGGEPGIGKSTLLMQMVASACCDGTRLYATGEESEAQVAMRAHRIRAAIPEIKIVRETSVEAILWHANNEGARIIVCDSIHTIHSEKSNGNPGSDHQVATCGQILMDFAKSTGITVILISHVNGDGDISGPKKFEHLGDVTLMFEMSELGDPWRVLRSIKNRFGSTMEHGMFQMAAEGLIPCGKDDEPSLDGNGGGDGDAADALAPIAQELVYRYLELGGRIDGALRDRIDGRLDIVPRSNPS